MAHIPRLDPAAHQFDTKGGVSLDRWVELFDRYALPDGGGGIWVYRLLSGFAHGQGWTTNFGVTAAVETPGRAFPLALMKVEASGGLVETLANVTSRAVFRALDEFDAFSRFAGARDFQSSDD